MIWSTPVGPMPMLKALANSMDKDKLQVSLKREWPVALVSA